MAGNGIGNTPESPLAQLCGRAKLSDESKVLLTDQFTTKEFLGLLVEKESFPDAIRLVAYLLPKREAIAWGCLCTRHILSGEKNKPLPAVQVAVERWVSTPNEENRWAARDAADAEESKTPSGLLAMAVFFAGPSLAPPNVQAVPPPEHMTSEIVSIAVVLAGVTTEPEKAKEKHRLFMQKALALIARLQQPKQ